MRNLASRVVLAAATLFCLFFVAPPAAMAGGFQVSPTIAEIPPGSKVATFQLRNPGTEPVTIQVDVLGWTQDTSGEELLPASDVVIAPRIAKIVPGGTQLVRVALRGAADQARSYRVRLREVPAPPPPGFVGVRPLVEQLVPLFFLAPGQAALDWTASLDASGGLALTVANTGTRHVRASALTVVDARGAVLAEQRGPRYVLPNSSVRWPLTTHARLSPGDELRIRLEGARGFEEVALTVE